MKTIFDLFSEVTPCYSTKKSKLFKGYNLGGFACVQYKAICTEDYSEMNVFLYTDHNSRSDMCSLGEWIQKTADLSFS